MFFQEFILALIILAYLAFALVLVLRVGATVSAFWKKHKRPERHQTGAKILYFPTATPRQNLSNAEDDRRAEVLRKKAENI